MKNDARKSIHDTLGCVSERFVDDILIISEAFFDDELVLTALSDAVVSSTSSRRINVHI